MRLTTVLRQAAAAEKKSFKSLALSVYFQHPDLTGGRLEILSRASAFLWSVDPRPSVTLDSGPYAHLEAAEQRRKERVFKQTKSFTPASGKGTLMEMGWLEYIPKEVRPQVHVVASSHVLSPFLWKEYYPQDWLPVVRQEHVSYALEVYDTSDNAAKQQEQQQTSPPQPLVKVALHPSPFHHPEGRDVALVHLKDEESSLKLLKKVGVDVLYVRDAEKNFEKGEYMLFDGYSVEEPDTTKDPASSSSAQTNAEVDDDDDNIFDDDEDEDDDSDDDDKQEQDDFRVFQTYREEGQLNFHTKDRFFAATPKPLPEGLCGAPVLDSDGDLCGVVEGIVPVTHADERLSGNAAFLPPYQLAAFVDFCERQMCQLMMPPDLFQMVVNAKKTNAIGGGGPMRLDGQGEAQESNWDDLHADMINNLKKKYSSEEVDTFLRLIRDESKEVLRILDEEGGEMDDIITRVRSQTLAARDKIHEEYRQAQAEKNKAE